MVIDWGEGSSETYSYPAGSTSYTQTHQYLDDNPTATASDIYGITVTVTDDDTGVDTATTTVTANNVEPIITANGSVIDENGVATVSGSITDPGSQDTFTVVIDWGEGSPETHSYPAGSKSYSQTHQYLDDNPTGTASDIYGITVTVTDDDTGVDTATTTVTVHNVAPVITAGGSVIDENGVATVSGTITDPGSQDSFTVVIDWGEGSPETYSYPAGSTSYSQTHQYPDDNPTGTASDVYDITVTVTDDDTGVDTATTTVTVNNVAPVITASGSVIDENGVATVSGDITDPGSQDTFTVVIDWGEGSPETYSYPAGSKSYSQTHQYLDDNPTGTASDIYGITVTVTDDDTGVDTATTTVTVNNVAPIITAGGSVIDESGVATVSGYITDPGSQDTFTVVIDWGEGSPETYSYPAGSKSYSQTHQYLDDNPTATASDIYGITVTVTDDDTGVDTATTTVTVNNVAPIITAGGSVIDENGVATVSGSITDPGSQDTFTVVIDWGEGSPETYSYPAGSKSYSQTHQYLDDNPTGTASDTYNVTVTVTDDDGGEGSATTTVTVNNVTPIITASGSVIDENGVATVSGDITDPGSQDTFTVVIDWGEGSPETYSYPAGSKSYSQTHQYLDDNPTATASDIYGITVTVTDDDTGVDTATTTVTVNNVAPVLGPITVPLAPLPVGSEVIATADFADTGIQDTHTAVWDWGDGTISTATISEANGSGIITGTHAYASEGVYTIKVTLTDDDGGSDTSVFFYDVVFLPDGTFVTGGGWIASPEGAYASDQSLTGKVHFGFVVRSRRSKGTTTYSGETQVQLRAGNRNFQSTSYDSLVFEKSTATYSGSGTLDGAGDYGFTVTVIDVGDSGDGGSSPKKGGGKGGKGGGGTTASDTSDTFRIKIWDKVTLEVIYDSQPGASDDADPTTPLGGGSIVIHKG